MLQELILTVIIRKQGTQYSALCPELDVASDGDTVEEAKKHLKEAVSCHVETILEVEGAEGLADRLGISKTDLQKVVFRSDSIFDSFEVALPV